MKTLSMIAAMVLASGSAAGFAAGQTGAGQTDAVARSSSVRPEVSTLAKMNRRMSLKVEDTRLEDVLKFIQDVTQAELEAFWTSDGGIGLDKDKKITVNIKNQPALYALEMVLEKSRGDSFSESTWQMSESGAIQIGPKEALNKFKRIVMYNIDDLLIVIPRYTEVPQIDLNNVLSSSGGGGGGQSPFSGDNSTNSPLDQQPTKEERAKKITDLLTSLVESQQWQDNGGDGATLHYFNGTLIINAADYIHRQINGYPYWPSGTRRIARAPGERRWVTLNMDTGIGTVDKIRPVPVTAVAGGQGGGATGTPGGGGTGGGGTGGGGSGAPGGPP
ncbi:MAG TPA: hypothetical protein PKE29_04625 [Phycisphaerales bacterium]|nr:hypothetical protein [Phycisphaerales bacterium]